MNEFKHFKRLTIWNVFDFASGSLNKRRKIYHTLE